MKAVENRKNTKQKIKMAEFCRLAEKDHVWVLGIFEIALCLRDRHVFM